MKSGFLIREGWNVIKSFITDIRPLQQNICQCLRGIAERFSGFLHRYYDRLETRFRMLAGMRFAILILNACLISLWQILRVLHVSQCQHMHAMRPITVQSGIAGWSSLTLMRCNVHMMPRLEGVMRDKPPHGQKSNRSCSSGRVTLSVCGSGDEMMTGRNHVRPRNGGTGSALVDSHSRQASDSLGFVVAISVESGRQL